MSDNKKKKAGLGFAVWFLLFLGVSILILINWKTISSNFNDLKNVVQGSRTEQQERKEEIAARKAEEKARRAAEKDAKEYARAQEKEQGGVTITLGGDKSSESNSASEKNQAQEETKKEESSQEQVKSESKPESKPESKGESNSETKLDKTDNKNTEIKDDQKQYIFLSRKMCIYIFILFLLLSVTVNLEYGIFNILVDILQTHLYMFNAE